MEIRQQIYIYRNGNTTPQIYLKTLTYYNLEVEILQQKAIYICLNMTANMIYRYGMRQ